MDSSPYQVVFFLPGNSGYDPMCTIDWDMPFLPFQVGDLINPKPWNAHYSTFAADSCFSVLPSMRTIGRSERPSRNGTSPRRPLRI